MLRFLSCDKCAIVSCFGQKCLLNALNVNINVNTSPLLMENCMYCFYFWEIAAGDVNNSYL